MYSIPHHVRELIRMVYIIFGYFWLNLKDGMKPSHTTDCAEGHRFIPQHTSCFLPPRYLISSEGRADDPLGQTPSDGGLLIVLRYHDQNLDIFMMTSSQV